jgi:hypothetical protein
MKINGFKKINLRNPKDLKEIKIEDKVLYTTKKKGPISLNGKLKYKTFKRTIEGLVTEKRKVTTNVLYRTKDRQGKEMICVDFLYFDNEIGKVRVITYEELSRDVQRDRGDYLCANKKLNEAGM